MLNKDACVYVCRGACWYETNGDRGCNAAHNAYSTTIYDAQRQGFVTVAPSWTRGLAIHPVGESSSLATPRTLGAEAFSQRRE